MTIPHGLRMPPAMTESNRWGLVRSLEAPR